MAQFTNLRHVHKFVNAEKSLQLTYDILCNITQQLIKTK